MTKTLYFERKEAGLCVACGKEPVGTSPVRCEPCRLKSNAVTWINRKENIEQGLCSVCPNARNLYRIFCDAHEEKKRVAAIKRSRVIKLEILNAYGGPFCACCGEYNIIFLTIDHVNNDGWKERSIEGKIRYAAYSRLKKLGFPNDPPLQVLCYNCNNGKRVNRGVCPHKDRTL